MANNIDLASAIDESRQWRRLMQMAEIGGIEENGVNRACLTPLDRQARRLLIEWARAAGATVSVDDAANLWLRREGSDSTAAPVLTGSHMDTQPRGGRFDGIYGVIAGLEVLTALHASNATTRRPVEVVAWTNEEGGRFAPGCMGSMAWSGHTPLELFAEARDPDDLRFADALAEHLAQEADLPRRPLGPQAGAPRPYAYIEAHIEQGPQLEAEGLAIGVVTGIQGSRWFTVTITGDTAHAGTTPLLHRRDAVQDMLRAVNALNALMHDPDDVLRFTVGRIVVEPNTSNSVARRVRFSIDLRHPDRAALTQKGDAIAETVRTAVKTCTAEVRESFHAMPVVFDGLVANRVEYATQALDLDYKRMPSGAFHDAQFVNAICPTGMIFVPCHRGVSHNPSEYSEPRHLAAGTRALALAVQQLASDG